MEVWPKNFVVKIATGNRTAKLPANKNLLIQDGRQIELEGVVVCAPAVASQTVAHVYVAQQAVRKILGRPGPLPPVCDNP